MQSDQLISEDNDLSSKTRRQSEDLEKNACNKKHLMADDIKCDIDATMELDDNIETTIDTSKSNDTSTDKTEEFENIQNSLLKIIEIQQCEGTEKIEKTVITNDDNDFSATMEIIDARDSKNLSIENSNKEDKKTTKNEDNEDRKAGAKFLETKDKNVELQISNKEDSKKSRECLDEMENEEEATEKTVTSLSSIALAYDNSDSESEQFQSTERNNEKASCEMEVQITKEYRTVNVTSDEDSDSSSSSSSDSSSDEESDDSDQGENLEKSITNKKNERNNGRFSGSHEKESKSEFDDLPPIEDLKISVPEVLCDPLGEVAWMVEQMVVVRPKPGKPTLNLDTILFVERGRRVLGRIFDVFGQISDPHYCVRFNSTEHIKESDIKVGMTAYFCPNTEYTSVVFVQDLLKMKATDELGDDEHPEFSDDEEERAYYAALKQKQKSEKAKTTEEIPQKRQRTGKDPGWKSNHPWSSGNRKQDQSKKPEENYNSPGRPGNTQRNSRNQANLWQQQYPPAYQNISWPPAAESYQENPWPPQNPYGYSEPFENRHQPGNSRAFFRPPHSFQTPPIAFMQNPPYSQQSNRCRFPGMNFPWQSPVPRQPNFSWRFSTPPPPPPPPPPGM